VLFWPTIVSGLLPSIFLTGCLVGSGFLAGSFPVGLLTCCRLIAALIHSYFCRFPAKAFPPISGGVGCFPYPLLFVHAPISGQPFCSRLCPIFSGIIIYFLSFFTFPSPQFEALSRPSSSYHPLGGRHFYSTIMDCWLSARLLSFSSSPTCRIHSRAYRRKLLVPLLDVAFHGYTSCFSDAPRPRTAACPPPVVKVVVNCFPQTVFHNQRPTSLPRRPAFSNEWCGSTF
jgi:hypothetical protein